MCHEKTARPKACELFKTHSTPPAYSPFSLIFAQFAPSVNLQPKKLQNSPLPQRSIGENAAAARIILQAINEGINQRIRKADRIKATDPAAAYNIYLELVTKYAGIEAIRPAQKAYLQLKNLIN
jgi:hypothetical protein